MAEKRKRADVVVIGLGAAGGTVVKPLAEAGLSVVGLEAGPRYTNRDFPLDEIRNDNRNWLGRLKFNQEIPTWRRSPGQKAGDPTRMGAIVTRMMNGVGGTSIHWTSQSWRFTDWNFRTRSQSEKRYGRGSIPSNSTVTDWPVSYDDLEPYYDRVEYLHGVSGKAGNIQGKKDPEGNIHESPRQREYPNPPLHKSGYMTMMADALRKQGYDPFIGPSAVRSRQYEGMPGCTYCGFCTNAGCYNDAKATTMLRGIPDAEETGNLEVIPNARALRIEVDNDGRATGVTFLRGGREVFQPARFVVLASYVYENTRLLLLSRSKAFPRGLANNAGQVGRHYMAHVYCGVNALFEGRKLNRFNGTGAQAICIDNLNGDNFDHKGLSFIGGGVVSAGHEAKPIATATSVPEGVPRWGSEWKRWIAKNANSIGGLFAQTECLPYEDSFLDLDPTEKDPLGLPRIRVTYDIHQQESDRYDYIYAQLERMLKEMGASKTWVGFPKIPHPVNTHAYGGTRMGDDPETSVVNGFCIAHEVPNLAVLGASTFVTTSGYNPTETVMALAWRSGDHIAENFERLTS
jgi:gluconate 2-dehydrogenase alpha chain